MSTMNHAADSMRLVNTATHRLSLGNTNQQPHGFSDDIERETLAQDDPRWIFAMRVRLFLEHSTRGDESIEDLLLFAEDLGLSPIAARGIYTIIESAQLRGSSASQVVQELLLIPEATPALSSIMSDRTRWLTFGALFVWAMMIAGLMQIVV